MLTQLKTRYKSKRTFYYFVENKWQMNFCWNRISQRLSVNDWLIHQNFRSRSCSEQIFLSTIWFQTGKTKSVLSKQRLFYLWVIFDISQWISHVKGVVDINNKNDKKKSFIQQSIFKGPSNKKCAKNQIKKFFIN